MVENFSYVFQASGRGAKSISREQMRSFKKVWAELSNPKTGYLERQNFTPFFGVRCNLFFFQFPRADCRSRNSVGSSKFEYTRRSTVSATSYLFAKTPWARMHGHRVLSMASISARLRRSWTALITMRFANEGPSIVGSTMKQPYPTNQVWGYHSLTC